MICGRATLSHGKLGLHHAPIMTDLTTPEILWTDLKEQASCTCDRKLRIYYHGETTNPLSDILKCFPVRVAEWCNIEIFGHEILIGHVRSLIEACFKLNWVTRRYRGYVIDLNL